MRVYYHPSVGEYAKYPSFEPDYALAGAGIGGLAAGAGSYALRKADGGSLRWGLAGALIGGAVGGALVPKRILSWFNPPPFDAPIRYPRQIPKVVVPSFIGESGQVLNFLFHHGAGDVIRDYSGLGNHGKIYGGASWVDGSWGWALSFDGVDDKIRIENPTFGATLANELSILLWFLIPNVETTQAYPGILKAETEGILFWTPKGAGNRPTGNCTYYLDWANRLSVTAPYVIGAWNHAAVTFKRPTEKVYVNGVFRGSRDVDVPIPAYSWLDIGKGDSYSFPGMMVAQVLFYNRALTDSEIKYHFESTRAIFGV